MYRRFATLAALFGLGFISIPAQIYLLREFLSLFQGNELVLGIALANWMLLTGFGAWLGRYSVRIKDKDGFILFLLILLSALPLLTILKLDVWRAVVFPYGTMVSLRGIFYSSLLLQTILCMMNGFLFTSLSSLLPARTGGNSPGTAYAVESFGSMVAGLLVNFYLLWAVGTYEALKVLSAFCVVVVILFAFSLRRLFIRIFIPVLSIGILIALWYFPFNELTLALLYPGQRILTDRETPYGRVIVTEQGGQKNFFENGQLLFSSGNVMRDEESVHPGMAQHPSPQNVLLISGGLGRAVDEIMKYHPRLIDYVELNPALTIVERALGVLPAFPQLNVINEDARRFIRHTENMYDVALISLPEPSSLQVNRYYTDEFFRNLKRKMAPGAVMVTSLPTGSDYVSEEAGRLNACLYNTLKLHFDHVLIFPAGRNFFIASDDTLSLRITEILERKGIENVYVNRYYLDEDQLAARSRFILSRLGTNRDINRDFRPLAYFYQQSYWLSYFRQNYILVAGIVMFVTVLAFLALNSVNAGLFSGGFTASSIEMLLLLTFQIAFGYVYQSLGMIIMIFMLGLTAGAAMRRTLFPHTGNRHFLMLQLCLAAFAALILVVISLIPVLIRFETLLYILFLLMAFGASFLVGLEFSVAAFISKGSNEKIAARNYSVELYGSALGALLTGVILVPLAGMTLTLVILAALNTLTAGVFLLTGRIRSPRLWPGSQ
jgi:spermidine synthase